ncbi:MAG: hypothetical protein EVA89_26780 [Sandaracinaceae bacterium]|nr:MAG: hypothetical protein EVA89_26780 [Sandaracinaceae bacterium]
MLVAIGGLAEVSAIFGRGGGDAARAHMVGLGLGFILTAVLVTAGPLLVGTLLAASRRPRAVAVSFAIAASAFVLPWCVIFLG